MRFESIKDTPSLPARPNGKTGTNRRFLVARIASFVAHGLATNQDIFASCLLLDSMIERLLHFLPDKIRPSSRVQGFPGFRVIVVRDAWPPVVSIIAVAVVGFPSHCLLARWLNLVSNVAGDISRTIVNLTIFRNRIPYVMGENVLALKCWIQICPRKKVSTETD